MVAIHISAIVGDDRTLVIQLPPEFKPGQIDLIIQTSDLATDDSARNKVRAKLLVARALVTQYEVLPNAQLLSVEERLRMGTLPPNVPSSLDLVNEDRGDW